MARNKQTKVDRQDKLYKKINADRKRNKTADDQVKATGEDVMPSLDTPFQPKEHEHAVLLAGAHSDKQRADLVFQLQQTYGNAYVQRLMKSNALQAKLTVNPSDDVYEREADKTADMVMQALSIKRQEVPEEEELVTKPTTEVQRQEVPEEEELVTKPTTEVQRQEVPEEEELVTKPTTEVQRQEVPEEEELVTKPTTEVQRQEVPEEEELVTKPDVGKPLLTSKNLETEINKARSGGQPLDESVRAPMERAFGADFSGVKVHADANADVLNQSLQARAFTTGEDIFFRSGEYRPDDFSGQRLLAHELTHVVQQQSVQTIQKEDGGGTAGATAISYNVGTVPVLAQPSSMTCWATVTAMLMGWRDGVSYSIAEAMEVIGPEYRQKFENNQGLGGEEKNVFLAAAGIQGEPPMNYTAEGLLQLMQDHGPLWVTTDEDPSALFAIHARILTGIEGDGTPTGTRLYIIDPDGGTEYTETIQRFTERYEEVTEAGALRVQVAHF